MSQPSESAAEIIARLGLVRHDEGGWFRETHRSHETIDCPDRDGVTRPLLTAIHYLLEAAQPRGVLHRNRSDIVHFHEGGGVLRYVTLTPEGELAEARIGPGFDRQFTVKAGVWKASELLTRDWGMAGEAVCPGFDYRDREIAKRVDIAAAFPQYAETLAPFLAQSSGAADPSK